MASFLSLATVEFRECRDQQTTEFYVFLSIIITFTHLPKMIIDGVSAGAVLQRTLAELNADI